MSVGFMQHQRAAASVQWRPFSPSQHSVRLRDPRLPFRRLSPRNVAAIPPQASKEVCAAGHRNDDSTSTSRPPWNPPPALAASLYQDSPKTPAYHHEQQRGGRGSSLGPPPTLGGLGGDNYNKAGAGSAAGDGGRRGDPKSRVTRHSPGAWSSWAKDDPSESTGPKRISTTDPKGMPTTKHLQHVGTFLCEWQTGSHKRRCGGARGR